MGFLKFLMALAFISESRYEEDKDKNDEYAYHHLMEELDKIYPGYGFSRHKGYGTAEHIRALRELGPCPAHRRSFIGKILEGQA